ncbi:bacterioferritin [Aliikangiella sp. G2MR2-5]|uniref:bacterioferritin n=1 Tax=Aliikangiella sp. G2MR2-5 TaxID=2788943 RepID=UPI0018AA5E87|nr:bacterioferritin [Aliikangiella sp. G2MR2-5]
MKGDKQIISQLNQVLKSLLTGINQYFLHSRMSENWGFNHLKKKDYDYSIYLMKASDKVIKRILFLEGLANLQDLGKLYLGEDVPQILSGNMRFDLELRKLLVEAIELCEKGSDYISREMLESILHECEEQVDWLEAQQYLIDHTGLENYLQSAV